MSAEPAASPQEHIIPQGILENSIKITNEPPTGMLANLHAALDNFDQVREQQNITCYKQKCFIMLLVGVNVCVCVCVGHPGPVFS